MNTVFTQVNQYFDKIYVITLDGYKDRQKSIETHFEGLNFTFWPGTDKRKLSEDVLKDISLYDDEAHRKTKRTSRSMTLAEYCCSMSHRRIYEDMLKNGYQKVLIFEDDAVPNLSTLHNFSDMMSSLTDNWDLVLFDYYDHYLEGFSSSLKQMLYRAYHRLHIANWQHVPVRLIDEIAMREHNQYFFKVGKCSGPHAYALSHKMAKHYVDMQTPIKLQADRVYYYDDSTDGLKRYAAKHPIFQRGEVAKISTIQ